MSQPVGSANKEVVNDENTTSETGQETGTNDSGHKDMSVEELRAELKKVRQEAASRRVALREQEEAAKKWKEYEESQKTELEKLQDQLAEKERLLAQKDLDVQRAKIAREYNVADEDLDLLVGDEENMKRLASRLGKTKEESNPANLLAGNRGKPVGKSGNTFSMEDFIRGSVRST